MITGPRARTPGEPLSSGAPEPGRSGPAAAPWIPRGRRRRRPPAAHPHPVFLVLYLIVAGAVCSGSARSSRHGVRSGHCPSAGAALAPARRLCLVRLPSRCTEDPRAEARTAAAAGQPPRSITPPSTGAECGLKSGAWGQGQDPPHRSRPRQQDSGSDTARQDGQ